MQIHPVDTLINVSDLGTKPLATERVAALSFLIGLRDGDLQPVGELEYQALQEKMRMRKVVRAPVRSWRLGSKRNLDQSVELLPCSALRAVPSVLLLLQGCEGYDDEYYAFEILIWSFASRVYANPVPSVCILIAMWLLPCVDACIACCTSRKQVIEVKMSGDAKDVHKSCANNERDDEAQASSDVPRQAVMFRGLHRALSGLRVTSMCQRLLSLLAIIVNGTTSLSP
eukprot:s1782_g20.t1